MTNTKHFLLWFAGIAFITLAVVYVGLEEIISALLKADLFLLGGLFLLQIGTLTLISYQWKFILNKQQQKETHDRGLSLGKVLAINLAGKYLESITPSVKIGGEAAKVYLFRRHTSLPYTRLTGMLLALKYISLIPFLMLAAIFLLVGLWHYQLPMAALGAFAALSIFIVLLSWVHHRGGKDEEKTKEMLSNQNNQSNNTAKTSPNNKILIIKQKALAAVNFIRKASSQSRNLVTPRESCYLMGISTLVWTLYPVKVYLVTNMLGLDLNIVTITVATFTAYVVSMVPLLPGGLGSFEATMVLMLTLAGLDPAQGLAVTLLSRLVTYWFPLLLSAGATAYLAYQGTLSRGSDVTTQSVKKQIWSGR